MIVRIRGKGESLRDVRAGAALDRRLVPQLFGPIRVPRKSCSAGDGFTARNGLAAGNIFVASDNFAFGYDFAAGYGFAARAVGRRCPLVAEHGHPDAVGKLERAGPLDRVDNERGLALRIDEQRGGEGPDHGPAARFQPLQPIPVPAPHRRLVYVGFVVDQDGDPPRAGKLDVAGDERNPHAVVEAEIGGHGVPGAHEPVPQVREEGADRLVGTGGVERDLAAVRPVDELLQEPRAGRGQPVRADLAGAERGDDLELGARGLHGVDEAGEPAGRREGPEGVQHSPVHRLAQAHGQNDGVAAQAAGLRELEDGERLDPAFRDELGQLGGIGGQPRKGFAYADRVGRGDADDGERFAGPRQHMVDDGVDRRVDLDLRPLDHSRLRIRHAAPLHEHKAGLAAALGRRHELEDVRVPLVAQRLGGQLVMLGAQRGKLAHGQNVREGCDRRIPALGPRAAKIAHDDDLTAAHEHRNGRGKAAGVLLVHDDDVGPGHGRHKLGRNHRRNDPHRAGRLNEPRIGGDRVAQGARRMAFELIVEFEGVLTPLRDRFAHDPHDGAGNRPGQRLGVLPVEPAHLGGEDREVGRRRA